MPIGHPTTRPHGHRPRRYPFGLIGDEDAVSAIPFLDIAALPSAIRRPAMTDSETARRPKVLIVGGGFGGLQAARSLKRVDVDVTLIDRRNFHLFQPLLYQVATGELSAANIAAPLRVVLRRQKNCTVVLGEVTGADLQKRELQTSDGRLSFDYLIVATGSQHHYFGNDHWAPLAPGLKTIENATEIRRQVLGAFEAAERTDDPDEAAEILTFVIVGAGPTGCEMAGALSAISRHTLRRDFRCINPTDAKIYLINSDDLPLEVYREPLPARAARDLDKLGVTLVNNNKVTDVTPTHVTLTAEDGSQRQIATRTVIWAAGVKASGMAGALCEAANLEPARGGRIPVQPDTSLAGHPNVFAIGDMVSLSTEKDGELPGLAPVATQMGRHAAWCIAQDLRQRDRERFAYRDKGSMAVIGRFSAIGEIGRLKVKGFFAWSLWLGVHLMYIALFRNRLLVLIQWGWTFLTHDRSARLITDGPDADISTMEEATGWDEDPALPSVKATKPGDRDPVLQPCTGN